MKNEIAKLLGEIKPGQHIYNTFFDWVTMMAYSISNPVFKEREERYKAIRKRFCYAKNSVFIQRFTVTKEQLVETLNEYADIVKRFEE